MKSAHEHPVEAAAPPSTAPRIASGGGRSTADEPIADRPPGRTRRLGRPRICTAADMPARLARWHAPRANRWEQIAVTDGVLETEWLWPASIEALPIAAGTQAWIAPGRRWRVAQPAPDLRFEISTHADETTSADAPQPVRAALLDALVANGAGDVIDPAIAIGTLEPGKLQLLRLRADRIPQWTAAVRAGDGSVFWHPLALEAHACIALVARAPHPVALADYMGRDHAVIEAALAGALRGDVERARWLRGALMRHLAIEERVLFPTWLRAGGDARLQQALLKEHADLRRHLPRLHEPGARRRFLLMLDGHDEKEEQMVYPDIAARVPASNALARTAMAYPLIDAEP